jgi:hypothetical protein
MLDFMRKDAGKPSTKVGEKDFRSTGTLANSRAVRNGLHDHCAVPLEETTHENDVNMKRIKLLSAKVKRELVVKYSNSDDQERVKTAKDVLEKLESNGGDYKRAIEDIVLTVESHDTPFSQQDIDACIQLLFAYCS